MKDSGDCGNGGSGPQEGLALSLLASFRVVLDGHPINGRLTGKAWHLLKILTLNFRRYVTKEALIEMLWPDVDPRTGAISLKVAAHKLRMALGQDRENRDQEQWILMDNGTYRLNRAANIWIDAEAFRQHYERGRRGINPRHEFEQAETLYQGDLLEEDIYEEWTLLQREELRDLYLDVLQRLAHQTSQLGDHSEVIRYCHKIVLVDPCREDAYRMLMRSHAALNQLARAGSWYAICRASLQKEIGAPPSTETVEVFEGLFDRPPRSQAFRALAP
ncbi:MAG: BTAD domain-containing putative transcriptional regulator [Dehalococcoidia bacterium]|nr:BTAD domain-containing putative transcriptional regulator [Dehalococcoidia bacterium]